MSFDFGLQRFEGLLQGLLERSTEEPGKGAVERFGGLDRRVSGRSFQVPAADGLDATRPTRPGDDARRLDLPKGGDNRPRAGLPAEDGARFSALRAFTREIGENADGIRCSDPCGNISSEWCPRVTKERWADGHRNDGRPR